MVVGVLSNKRTYVFDLFEDSEQKLVKCYSKGFANVLCKTAEGRWIAFKEK